MLTLLAQVVAQPDPIAAWGSLALQGGAFGLLVYIIVWAYPAATKAAADERSKTLDRFEALVAQLHQQFENRNLKLEKAISSQTVVLATSFKDHADRIERAVGAVCKVESRGPQRIESGGRGPQT
jgi:hypothetical protein